MKVIMNSYMNPEYIKHRIIYSPQLSRDNLQHCGKGGGGRGGLGQTAFGAVYN